MQDEALSYSLNFYYDISSSNPLLRCELKRQIEAYSPQYLTHRRLELMHLVANAFDTYQIMSFLVLCHFFLNTHLINRVECKKKRVKY